MKSETKKMIRNFLFFVIVIVLTYTVIFSKLDMVKILDAVRDSKIIFLVIALILASNNITCEAVNLKRNFKLLGDQVRFRTCLKYSTIGFFFSSITPASTGGQPMQLISMNKDGISYSHGASALFMSYLAYMLTTVTLAIVGFVINYNYISEISFFKYLIYIGLIANSFLTLVVILAMFAPRIAQKGVNLLVFIVNRFSHAKAKKLKKSLSYQLSEYNKSSKFILSHKWATFKTFLVSMTQVISIHSVAYFVYAALGYQGYSYIDMLLLQSVVFITVSAIPLPGTVGVSETGFAIMYKRLFPTHIVETSMLLSRGLSFYLLVIISGIVISVIGIRKKMKQRK